MGGFHMNPRVWFLCVALTVLGGCSHAPPPAPVEVAESARTVSFTQDVRPILDSRCVVCHSCYNSPCQLKLSSFEGLERGGTDLPVYDSSRFRAQEPTRLFMDAKSAEERREKGFHSLRENTAGEGLNNSLMLQLLDAGMTRPELSGDFRPETDELSCSANDNELGEYLEDRPNGGMPFGFPALSQPEYETIAAWLQQGMPGPSPKEQRAMTTPSPAAAPEVAKWEQFLNQSDPKYAMTARYLYEHYFLAHLSFVDASPLEFYELVRSSTAPGKPIEIIATVRPYDRPDTETYY